ncbi:MAG: response regulator transcription factor [Spirochaetes bacterium]|nr:response regulator transcription factor [Spirochaetota bacterium]
MHDENIYDVLIAEDEAPARELITDYLLTRPELRLAGIVRSGDEALRELNSREFDLVFMDIHLPCMSGIEVLERLQRAPYVVFTTAYDRYALQAFDLGVVDYLLKPFSAERFDRAVDRFLYSRKAEELNPHHGPDALLNFREGGRRHILPCRDIMYVTSHGRKSIIHTGVDDIEISMLLKQIEARVPSETFTRVHKRYLVNIHHIGALEYYIGGQYLLFLKNNDETPIPVGKKYASLLKARLNMA